MSAVPITNWQAGFMSILPVVHTHAKIQFRALKAERRAEAIQEAIASACVSYQLLAVRGRLHVARPGMIADFAVRFVRNGRHVGGHQDAAKDVLSPRAQKKRGLTVRSYEDLKPQTNTEDWQALVLADRNVPIPDTVAFRIDFGNWLKTLTSRDRRIIAALVRGERAMAVAKKFGLSQGRVSQLRRRYEREWAAFQGEAESEFVPHSTSPLPESRSCNAPTAGVPSAACTSAASSPPSSCSPSSLGLTPPTRQNSNPTPSFGSSSPTCRTR